MPKKANLENHLNVQELKQKYKISQDTVKARRWQLLWKIALGWTIKNSALAVGIDYEYAKKIVKKYNESGVEGVKNKRKEAQPHVLVITNIF
jgi:molybdenum-dependent DNA-binding transcriptional regulator ModE